MLVLARIIGQSIRFNDEIYLTVLDVGGGKVKIGISSPMEIPVFRAEVHHRSKCQATLKKSGARAE